MLKLDFIFGKIPRRHPEMNHISTLILSENSFSFPLRRTEREREKKKGTR